MHVIKMVISSFFFFLHANILTVMMIANALVNLLMLIIRLSMMHIIIKFDFIMRTLSLSLPSTCFFFHSIWFPFTGNFVPPQTFVSTGSQIMIALRRFHGSGGGGGSANYDHNDEFIDGAYMFHDGQYLCREFETYMHLFTFYFVHRAVYHFVCFCHTCKIWHNSLLLN